MKAQVLMIALLSGSALAASETYKMYEEAGVEPSELCDVYTELKLNVDGETGTAQVKERVRGACDMFVAPNPRDYALVKKRKSCGSVIYQAAEDEAPVEITDHSTRVCEDIVPARILMQEYDAEGAELPLEYSYDGE